MSYGSRFWKYGVIGLVICLIAAGIAACVLGGKVLLPGCTVQPDRHSWVVAVSDASVGWFEFVGKEKYESVVSVFPGVQTTPDLPLWAHQAMDEHAAPPWVDAKVLLSVQPKWVDKRPASGVHTTERIVFWKTEKGGYVLYVGID